MLKRRALTKSVAEKEAPKLKKREIITSSGIAEKSSKHIDKIRVETAERNALQDAQNPKLASATYSGKPVIAFALTSLKVSYRLRDGQPQIEQRRYYIGSVQIAYVRIDAGIYNCFLSHYEDRIGLLGEKCKSEAALHNYIKEQLQA